ELDTPSAVVQAEQDNAEVAEAVERLRVAALEPSAGRADLIALGKSARKDFLLRQYTSDGEQVQDLLMRRLSELGAHEDPDEPEPDDASPSRDALDAMECGCSSSEVVAAGDHRPGCSQRRSS